MEQGPSWESKNRPFSYSYGYYKKQNFYIKTRYLKITVYEISVIIRLSDTNRITGCGAGTLLQAGAGIFRHRFQCDFWAPQASVQWVIRKICRSVRLSTYPCLIPTLIMHGVLPLLPHTSSWSSIKHLHSVTVLTLLTLYRTPQWRMYFEKLTVAQSSHPLPENCSHNLEPAATNPVSLRFILILFSHLQLDLASELAVSSFRIKMFAFSCSPSVFRQSHLLLM
jgi:hypothetical protein